MDISEIVQQQRAFFSTGQTRPVSFRIDSLKKLKQAVAAHEADILSALRSDLNKPNFEGYMTEIGMVLDELSFMLSHVKKWAQPPCQNAPSRILLQEFCLSRAIRRCPRHGAVELSVSAGN